MKALFFVLSVIVGIIIAWILNKFLTDKIDNKEQRIGLKITSYIVCILISMGFVFLGSLPMILDDFIESRINDIEITLSEIFPDSNILEHSIETSEFASASGELQQIINYMDTDNDIFFEKLIYKAFLKRFTNYVYTAKNGIDTMVIMSDDNGLVTINSILYGVKDRVLSTASRYCLIGQIVLIFLLLVYIGILIYMKKNGVIYNKSIVFGEIDYDSNTQEYQSKE